MHIRTKPEYVFKIHAGERLRVERIPTEGILEYEPGTGWEVALEFLYKAIGCDLVQFLSLPCGHMFVDEEGLLKPRPQSNSMASYLYTEGKAFQGVAGHAILIVNPDKVPDADAFLAKQVGGALRIIATYSAGWSLGGLDVDAAMAKALDAHASERYEEAALFYAIVKHESTDELTVERASKAFDRTIANIVSQVMTMGVGW